MLTIKCVVEFSKFLSFWIVREKGQGGTEFLISCIFFNYYFFYRSCRLAAEFVVRFSDKGTGLFWACEEGNFALLTSPTIN